MKNLIALTEEQLRLYEEQAHIVKCNGETFYFLPFWIKQNVEGEFEILYLDKLPADLKTILKESRKYFTTRWKQSPLNVIK